jgi:hypothetical protein
MGEYFKSRLDLDRPWKTRTMANIAHLWWGFAGGKTLQTAVFQIFPWPELPLAMAALQGMSI